jgi:hypothetical protein
MNLLVDEGKAAIEADFLGTYRRVRRDPAYGPSRPCAVAARGGGASVKITAWA